LQEKFKNTTGNAEAINGTDNTITKRKKIKDLAT